MCRNHPYCDNVNICYQGWISGAELRFMLANMGEKMSFEEVDMLLEEAGVDDDGKFRYNEFIDQLNRD